MSYTNKLMENYRMASIFAIENSQNVEEIKVALNSIGYNETRIQEGAELHTFFADAVQAQIAARREQYSKTMLADTAFDKAFSVYLGLVNLFRTSLEKEKNVMEELGLFGKRDQTASGFIVQSTHFYNTLLQKNQIFNKISKFQITKEMLQADLALVKDFEKANQAKRDAIGAFQRATEVRDKAYLELRHWMREFEKSCQIVLKDKPQLCERLGFRQMTDISRRKTPVPIPPETTALVTNLVTPNAPVLPSALEAPGNK